MIEIPNQLQNHHPVKVHEVRPSMPLVTAWVLHRAGVQSYNLIIVGEIATIWILSCCWNSLIELRTLCLTLQCGVPLRVGCESSLVAPLGHTLESSQAPKSLLHSLQLIVAQLPPLPADPRVILELSIGAKPCGCRSRWLPLCEIRAKSVGGDLHNESFQCGTLWPGCAQKDQDD